MGMARRGEAQIGATLQGRLGAARLGPVWLGWVQHGKAGGDWHGLSVRCAARPG